MKLQRVSKLYSCPKRILSDLKSEPLRLSIKDSSLAGVLTRPHPQSDRAAILLHPHPLYGGNMDNHVVKELERIFLEMNFITLRFDFRGASNTNQGYAGIQGAIEDACKAIDFMEIYELNSLGLVGYSFGATAALCAASSRPVSFVITLSASYDIFLEGGYDETYLAKIQCPVLMFHGKSDTMISHSDLDMFSSMLTHIKTVSLENENHFYEHALPIVTIEIRSFISNILEG